LIALTLVFFLLPETLPAEKRHPANVLAAVRRYGVILGERNFLANAMMVSAAMFTVFAFMSSSPALIPAYHISTAHFGYVLTFAALPFILSAQLNPRLLALLGTDRVIRIGVTGVAISAILLLLNTYLWHPPLGLLIANVMLTTGSIGLVMPNASISALSRHPQNAGSASAMLGTFQFLSAALCGTAAGAIADGTVRPIAELILAGAIPLVIAQMIRLKVRAALVRV